MEIPCYHTIESFQKPERTQTFSNSMNSFSSIVILFGLLEFISFKPICKMDAESMHSVFKKSDKGWEFPSRWFPGTDHEKLCIISASILQMGLKEIHSGSMNTLRPIVII